MTPEQVPDEQVLAVLAAWFDDGREEIADYDGEDVRAAQEVTVVIREQVAQEIEQKLAADGDGSDWGVGMYNASRIARGAS